MKSTRDTMGPSDDKRRGMSRREFPQSTGLTTMALGAGALGWKSTMAASVQSPAKATGAAGDGPYNILFILTNQERYFHPTEYPSSYALPGRERLQRRGVTFTNHYINSAVCPSSRSVIYTGQHIQHTKLFDSMNVPWTKD